MEALTRLVSDSLARYGFNRPIDPRRLQWSRWFLCDSPHSLLVVPSKPGIFAVAEEVMSLENDVRGGADTLVRLGNANANVGTAALGCPTERSSVAGCIDVINREGHDFSPEPALSEHSESKEPALSERSESKGAAKAGNPPSAQGKRMLAILQFSEDDDMAFTLDRMFTKPNGMRERLASGRCFIRFVVIDDEDQRRSICNALNQWLLSSAERASGIPAGFSSSLELTRVERVPSSAAVTALGATHSPSHMDSGSNRNLHCPHALPSGF
jgi:hypothetical protein